ncbi:type III pantothenate kinase [Paralimibaculum aggregatum]|uniref:Type III pantothenate kinase n=1 Tax=Paralimibaculum aggregatum TaxID=3036245 RepID=A0ABQ6LT12_9RHOB|nr:type III pantothenate kinase [Limibaculum sp. NKW23]GMG85217.1 type III pantothenate kinase [Limibaculum sp. NKW23]
MLLAIDVGNTNTVFALHDGRDFVASWRCNTESVRTADQYFVWLNQLMRHSGHDPADIESVVISNVAPAVLFNLRLLCDRYFDTRPLVVGKDGCRLPVDVRVDNPREVGADRLVNTVAAYETYGPNLIVVDFGTATTFDVVGRDGAYVGGVIAPGINLSLSALHAAAAHLPHIDVTMPQKVVGTNTVECMQSGVYWGYIGLIEGICTRISAEKEREMTVLATGGLAPLFARGSNLIKHVDGELTMRGLVLIHRHNLMDSHDR